MPTLADIYSAINTAKRKTSDFVQNPSTSLEQMLGYANDRARDYNQQMYLAGQGMGAPARGQQATPEQLAAQQGVMDTMAGAYNPVGMISKTLEAKFPNVSLNISENPKSLDLSKIVVPKEIRGQGIGSSVMNDLTQYADETGKQINLTPSADFGGNVNRLKSFYKNFGFIENKGKNKDFTTRETMIRPPIETLVVSEYGMAHRPMTVESGAARLHDLTTAFDDTIYGKSAIQNYGTGAPALDREAVKLFQQVRNKPDAMVTVYRAVPKNAKQTGINTGDWITVSKQYAMEHGEGTLGGNYKIVSQKVPAKHITTNADSILEQGYYP
jgi:predicted GNAT family N-acyltransferase